MKIGILGGTFDPIHNAHLRVARLAKDALGLSDVFIIPTGDPPHKRARASREARMAMAAIAAGEAGFTALPIEVEREGATYTIDTLRLLGAKYPIARFTYLLGTDTLYQLPHWRSYKDVVRLVDFAVVRRPGEDSAHQRAFADSIGARVSFIDAAAPDISSTDIRVLRQLGESARGLAPDAVCEYMERNRLYMPIADMMEELRRALAPRRYEHTLGVIATSEELARLYGVNPRRAYLAAALHDCAKSMKFQDMQALTGAGAEWGKYPQTLHAWAGAIVAERKYNVFDPEVLSAIRKHTTAAAEMSTLDLIIYVADAIEPNRRPYRELAELRATARRDILKAARMCAESSCRYNGEAGRCVHPDTLLFLGLEEQS